MISESTILETLGGKVGSFPYQTKAWDTLQQTGLPHKKSESYKFTPIASILEKNIDWDLKGDTSIDKELLYDEEGSHLIFVNGKLDEQSSMIQEDLLLEQNDVSEGKHDPFSLLNASLAHHEVTLHSGTKLPVFVYHFNSDGIVNPRLKVHVKDGDSIRVFEKLIPTQACPTFNNSYVEYHVGRSAQAFHTKVQNYHDQTYSHETIFSKVARDGHFYSNTFSFEGAMVRNNLTINLEGENCEGHMYGIFLLDKKSHVDNNTSVDHIKPNSYSNELYKGILDEKSTGVFNGKIYVRQDAQKTNAFQSNNNILLSDDATIHTKPQLEIWADDVKCSHGCTSGQLDEDAIFYLRARGINERNAKAMLLNAFATETMNHIGVETVINEVQTLIDQKLS